MARVDVYKGDGKLSGTIRIVGDQVVTTPGLEWTADMELYGPDRCYYASDGVEWLRLLPQVLDSGYLNGLFVPDG